MTRRSVWMKRNGRTGIPSHSVAGWPHPFFNIYMLPALSPTLYHMIVYLFTVAALLYIYSVFYNSCVSCARVLSHTSAFISVCVTLVQFLY